MRILTPDDIDDSFQDTYNQIKVLLISPVALERTKDSSVWIQPSCSCREGNDKADKLQGLHVVMHMISALNDTPTLGHGLYAAFGCKKLGSQTLLLSLVYLLSRRRTALHFDFFRAQYMYGVTFMHCRVHTVLQTLKTLKANCFGPAGWLVDKGCIPVDYMGTSWLRISNVDLLQKCILTVLGHLGEAGLQRCCIHSCRERSSSCQ